MIKVLTKYGRLPARAEVMVGKVKQGAQFLRKERHESFMILLPNKAI